MIPMRFVSLENGKFAKISYFSSYSVGREIVKSFLPLYFKMKPSSYANLTKAISSGLDAWSTLSPSSKTGVTLLQRMRAVAKSRCRNSCLRFAFFFILNHLIITVLGRVGPREALWTFWWLWRYLSWGRPYRRPCISLSLVIISWRPCRCRWGCLFCHSVNTQSCLITQEWNCFCRLFLAVVGHCWFYKKNMSCKSPNWLSRK
jgi:hypothetical protein